jgi:hypothetical protein
MRNGAEPLSQTHHLIAEILPERRPAEMQTVYFQCMEDGPESLLAPIEAEFAKGGPRNGVRLMASVITAERIADLIEQAPGWALVGLTVPQERLRADARREVAEHVYSALYQPLDTEAGQLPLPL